MAVELKPGSASAEAHKAAGAAVASPEFAKVARDFAGGGGGDEPEPAPAAEPEPVDAPDDPGDGSSPEPAAPADPAKTPDKDDDDEDLDDDYDEEDVAEPAPADDGDPQPAPAATDSDKTWSQYKTEDERKKALHENKSYGIKMAARAKELEAENARLKAGPSPGAEPAPKDPGATSPPAPQTVETVLRRLVETDPQVASAVNALQTQRESIAGRAQQIEKLRETVSATEERHDRALHVLEYLEEQSKADPDNYQLVEVIKAKRIEITSLETSANSGHIKLARLENDLGKDQDTYRKGLVHVREFAETNARASEDKAKADAIFKTNYEKANKAWDTALPKVFEKFNIKDPKTQKRVNVMLLKAAALESDDIDDIPAWMLAQGQDIHEIREDARREAIAGYKASKNKDAHQPAPDGPAAVATHEPRVARNSREADRIAGKRLKESLAGGRS